MDRKRFEAFEKYRKAMVDYLSALEAARKQQENPA